MFSLFVDVVDRNNALLGDLNAATVSIDCDNEPPPNGIVSSPSYVGPLGSVGYDEFDEALAADLPPF